jgi:hypothetical protein
MRVAALVVALAVLFRVAFLGEASLDPKLQEFIETKRARALLLARQSHERMPAEVRHLFAAMRADRWSEATNLYGSLNSQWTNWTAAADNSLIGVTEQMLGRTGHYTPRESAIFGPAWHAVNDAYWAYFLHKTWQPAHRELAVRAILETVPTNAFFFGGTDLGRFAVAAAMDSQEHGQPFVALTQHQLATEGYLAYLNSLPFEGQPPVWLPTNGQERAELNAQVQALPPHPGSQLLDWQAIRVAANERLSQEILKRNPDRRVFFEECVPWLYEWTKFRLLPRGPVYEISREPIVRIPDEVLLADRGFWSNWCHTLLGRAIQPYCMTTQACDYAEQIHLTPDGRGSSKRPAILTDKAAREWYSAHRHRTGFLYFQHCMASTNALERQRLGPEAELAFQQAFVLNPAFCGDWVQLLCLTRRTNDAIRVLETALRIQPEVGYLKEHLDRLRPPAREAR